MAVTPNFLTAAEVAAVAGRLAGRRCSPRQVRYLLVDGGVGTDTRRRAHGQTRLYGVVDVAFVRLALRLHGEGVSRVVTRVVLTYLRNDLVRAWKAGGAVALAIVGLHGSLQPALKTRPPGVAAFVPLREIWHGLEHEVHRAAASRRTVWMWRAVAVDAVPRATV